MAYNLCVEKPAYGTEGNNREKNMFDNRRVGSSRAKQAPRLSPIKIQEITGPVHNKAQGLKADFKVSDKET